MMSFYLSGIFFFILSIVMFMFSMLFMFMKYNIFMEWNIYMNNSVKFNMFIYIDWMMLMFIFVVLLISSMIMFYCIEYMSHDEYNNRFYYFLLTFILSMIFMIISPNLISMLIGWDGLGLSSFLLVIYYQNINSMNSGMLTVYLNRIGDLMIMFSISLIFMYGSYNYMFMNKINMIILILVMLACFTKSAQFPFSSWLPAAMAAPTPISSLVHSSTLVTAGVYFLIRFHYLVYLNLELCKFITFIGLVTMFMAGMSANFEYDLKKIIAYSTLSQLGLMMMIFGMNNWELSYFHLILHAMFKSMMFMCSGNIIHLLNNIQDIRYMGSIKLLFPLTSMMFMIANLSLCGLPFMSGFFSKDQILEMMFMINNSIFMYLLILVSTGLTVCYSIRLMYYLMNNNFMYNGMMKNYENNIMNLSMMILTMFSIFFGYLMNLIIFNEIDYIILNWMEKIIIIIMCLMFIFLGMMMYKMKYNNMNYFNFFMGKMWFLNNFIPLIIFFPLKYINIYNILYDKGWSEMYLYMYINNLMMILSNYMIFFKVIMLNLMNCMMFFMIIMILF
nr:NADH dehydrogenase subunit 5 [Pachycrepoideus vindemmiae]